MSKLDRLWLSVTWCDTWPNCIQTVLQRGLSDHVLVVLLSDATNGDLGLFGWWSVGRIILVMWTLFVTNGELLMWKDGAVLCWNRSWRWLNNVWKISINNNRRICVLDNKITEMKNQISSLDTKGEEFALLDDEVQVHRELSVSLHSMSWVQTSIN